MVSWIEGVKLIRFFFLIYSELTRPLVYSDTCVRERYLMKWRFVCLLTSISLNLLLLPIQSVFLWRPDSKQLIIDCSKDGECPLDDQKITEPWYKSTGECEDQCVASVSEQPSLCVWQWETSVTWTDRLNSCDAVNLLRKTKWKHFVPKPGNISLDTLIHKTH